MFWFSDYEERFSKLGKYFADVYFFRGTLITTWFASVRFGVCWALVYLRVSCSRTNGGTLCLATLSEIGVNYFGIGIGGVQM